MRMAKTVKTLFDKVYKFSNEIKLYEQQLQFFQDKEQGLYEKEKSENYEKIEALLKEASENLSKMREDIFNSLYEFIEHPPEDEEDAAMFKQLCRWVEENQQ